jgi:hypothetical protein
MEFSKLGFESIMYRLLSLATTLKFFIIIYLFIGKTSSYHLMVKLSKSLERLPKTPFENKGKLHACHPLFGPKFLNYLPT